MLDGVAEDDTADTAKSVDADLDHCDFVLGWNFGLMVVVVRKLNGKQLCGLYDRGTGVDG